MSRAAARAEFFLVVAFAVWILLLPGPRIANRVDPAERPAVSLTGPSPAAVAALPLQAVATAAVHEPNVGIAVVRVADGQIAALASTASPFAGSLAYQVGLRPGSSLKPYFYGAALDAGVLGAHETLVARPSFQLDDRAVVRNSFDAACGGPWQEALARSCNTAMAEVGGRLGARRVNRVVARLDDALAHTAARDVGPPPRFATADEVPIAEVVLGGARTRLTALQAATLVAAVARDGVAPGGVRVMSPRAARLVADAMVAAADHGTARRLQAYGAAAKTGTSDWRDTKNGWVCGFWPAEDPQFAFAVVALGSERRAATGAGLPSIVAGRLLRALGAAA